jgi:uroporphyrinogen decarboxylase
MDGGINCMFPVEVHAGSDPMEIRRRYPNALMQGGFNQRILAPGKQEILAELKRLKPLVKEGGFVPGVDHRVPADVTYKNYRVYLEKKERLLRV